MTVQDSISAKAVAGFLGVAMAFTFAFAGAFSVSAQDQTIEDLLEQIAALQAQLEELQGGNVDAGAGCELTFTSNLSQGDTGSEVLQLQKFLNARGHTVSATGAGSAGQETDYFGPRTHQAVVAFQNANSAEILAPVGLVSGTGYWGPSSRAHANAVCAMQDDSDDDMDDGDDDDGDDESDELEGGAGSIEDTDWVSGLNSEDVGEGEDDVEVAGIEIEADDGSDIEIIAIALNFDKTSSGSGSDDDFDDYANDVSIWFDGEKLADVDADEFDDDNNYSKTISLDSGAIIRAGDEETLTIAVSGVSNLDSNNEDETWNVGVENLRFRDAQNAVITDSSSGSTLGDDDDDSTTGSDEREFSFETFASASDIGFEITEGDNDDTNDARIIEVDDSDETDNVDILAFEVEIEGDSDVNLDDLPVTFTSTGGDIEVVASEVSLWVDGDEIGSENVPSSATTSSQITFADLDFDMEAGETFDFVVKANIIETGGTLDEGDTLKAEIGENETDAADFDAEDSEGDDLADSDVSGAAESEAHVFYENAFQVSNIETSFEAQDTSDSAVDSKGVYKFEFDVTAFGADVYIATTTASTAASADAGIEFSITGDSYPSTSTITSTLEVTGEDETGGDSGDATWKVSEGSTETFILTVNLDNTNGGAGVFGVEVDTIRFIDSEDTSFNTGAFLGDFFDNDTAVTAGNIDQLDISNQSLN